MLELRQINLSVKVQLNLAQNNYKLAVKVAGQISSLVSHYEGDGQTQLRDITYHLVFR